MYIYTILFTLVGVEPSKNRYIDMFFIWISYIIRNSGLNLEDKIIILIDETTLNFLNDKSNIVLLTEKSKVPIAFHIINQPKTITEGILERYNINNLILSPLTLFLDLDILVIKNIKTLLSVSYPKDTLIVMGEGKIHEECYAGNLIDLPKELEGHCGFSAGWFLFSAGNALVDFFKIITKECLENIETPRYTIDQPFYNKYIYKILYEKIIPLDIKIASKVYLDNNTFDPSPDTYFINYAGIPGDDTFHYDKLFSMLCKDFIESPNSKEVSEKIYTYH